MISMRLTESTTLKLALNEFLREIYYMLNVHGRCESRFIFVFIRYKICIKFGSVV